MNAHNLRMFVGHFYPGVLLIILGTWWAFNVWRQYFVSRLHRRPYHGTALFPLRWATRTICVDGIYLMVTGALGIAHYIWWGMSGGHFTNTKHSQHLTLFMFYGLSGLLSLLSASKLPLPAGTDYVGLLMAFSVQGLLFHFHLHDRSAMDVLVHRLFVFCTVATAVCIAIEMNLRQSALAALGRTFFVIMQGTWIIQIAFILYSPGSDGQSLMDDHQGLMLAVAVYTWHMFGIVVYLGFLGGLTRLFMSSMKWDKAPEQQYSFLSNFSSD